MCTDILVIIETHESPVHPLLGVIGYHFSGYLLVGRRFVLLVGFVGWVAGLV